MTKVKLNKIRRILIANRGEIVSRIVRSAKLLGVETVVVVAPDDKNLNYVREATFTTLLDEGTLSETYLNIPLLIEKAKLYEVDAIHPGYGFLSEDPNFARAVIDAEFIWVGPLPETIQQMGNKMEAKKMAESLGIPVLNSFTKVSDSTETVSELTFPVLVKPANGGGGKGMRIAQSAAELDDAMERTGAEALRYFGNGEVFVEEYIAKPRHIEVQVLADQYGSAVHLFERDCTVQRRYQKILEEAPAAGLSEEIKQHLYTDALKLVKAVDYHNAGTVEFLVDEKGQHFFLEMNTRLQVEHPVTEEITGIDLVAWQIKIADGQPLGFTQDDVSYSGHAIELRINAENPSRNFTPSAGKISRFIFPSAIRLETALRNGLQVSTAYDPLLAKVIVKADTREEALEKLENVLKVSALHGLQTNLSFLYTLVQHPSYTDLDVFTRWCDDWVANETNELSDESLQIALAAYVAAKSFVTPEPTEKLPSVWQQVGYWRSLHRMPVNVEGRSMFLKWQVNPGREFSIETEMGKIMVANVEVCEHMLSFCVGKKQIKTIWSFREGRSWQFTFEGITLMVKEELESGKESAAEGNGLAPKHVVSPLPGKVIEVKHKEGDLVKKGAPLVVIESMKMENSVLAIADCIIKKVLVVEGQQLSGKEVLMELANN